MICFKSFTFITQNVWMVRVREGRRRLNSTQSDQNKIFSEHFFFLLPSSRNLSGYKTSRTPKQILVVAAPLACYLHNARGHTFHLHNTYANCRDHSSSSLPSIQCAWTHFLVAYHLSKSSRSRLLQPTQ